VFVSYRREDVPDATYRLVDALNRRFGSDGVFFDVDKIELGAPFADVIEEWVASCDVLLAVIGEGWLDARGENGARRLENPGDFVRLEIEAALTRDIRVVPVLIHNAPIPGTADLPDSMAQLPGRNAMQITRTHWDVDVAKLIEAIERVVGERPGPALRVLGAPQPAPVTLRAGHQPGSPRGGVSPAARAPRSAEPGVTSAGVPGRAGGSPATGRLRWRMIGLAIAAAVIGAAIAVLASKGPSIKAPLTTQVAKTGTEKSASSGASEATSAGSAPSTPSGGTQTALARPTPAATVTQQPQSRTAATTASSDTAATKAASTIAPRHATAGPLTVVSHYWQDIGKHRFKVAYGYLAPNSIAQTQSQFVAGERGEGIKSARFAGATTSVSESVARVEIKSLVTRDSRHGCREWTGSYGMSALDGRWLIQTAEIQPQRCHG
jgi:hypothetical protein